MIGSESIGLMLVSGMSKCAVLDLVIGVKYSACNISHIFGALMIV